MSDWAAVASALFAAVALIFAGRQVMLGNQQAEEERRLGIEGVGVSWRSHVTPAEADADGYADWVYDLTVDNPGRFPIDHVEVRWVFPCLIRRVHYNDQVDDPTNELYFHAPVLTGRSQREWRRRLRINFDDAKALPKTRAAVSFRDIDHKRRTNHWPRAEQ